MWLRCQLLSNFSTRHWQQTSPPQLRLWGKELKAANHTLKPALCVMHQELNGVPQPTTSYHEAGLSNGDVWVASKSHWNRMRHFTAVLMSLEQSLIKHNPVECSSVSVCIFPMNNQIQRVQSGIAKSRISSSWLNLTPSFRNRKGGGVQIRINTASLLRRAYGKSEAGVLFSQAYTWNPYSRQDKLIWVSLG